MDACQQGYAASAMLAPQVKHAHNYYAMFVAGLVCPYSMSKRLDQGVLLTTMQHLCLIEAATTTTAR
jgi:hypothetical protein